MKKIELVIFDLDGLLVDSEKHMWGRNMKILGDELGYKYDTKWHQSLMGSAHDSFRRSCLNFYGNDFPFDTYFQKLIELNEKSIDNKEIPLMNGAIEILEYLKNNNIKFTLATSTKIDLAKKMLSSCGIDKYFNIITTGDEVNKGKPAPDIYNVAVSKFDVPKENVIVLEDGHVGFTAAYNAGLDCVIVEDFAILQDFDRQNAYKVVHNLKEVITLIENSTTL